MCSKADQCRRADGASPASERAKRERLRRRYRPAHIRLLFVGESPPASGRFFYCRNSGLYRAMRDAFRRIDSSVTDKTFLDIFQNSGCFLIDACADPVDRLDPSSRRAKCLTSEPALSRRIRRLDPGAVVILVKAIEENVRRAAARGGYRGPIFELPYPGRWARHRESFLERVVPILKELSS